MPSRKMSVRDRRSGFTWLGNREMNALRDTFHGRELATAIAVYTTLCESANSARDDVFTERKSRLADQAGVSTRTLASVLGKLREIRLIAVEERLDAPFVFTLLGGDIRGEIHDPKCDIRGEIHDPGGVKFMTPPHVTMQEKEQEPPKPPGDDPVVDIFEHYKRATHHPGAMLDIARRRVITRALRVATAEECKRAISGCSRSDFHMARGKHKGERRQDHLSLVLRNRENIERFMAMAPANSGIDGADGFMSSAGIDMINEHKRMVLRAFDLAGSPEADLKGDESERALRKLGIEVVRAPGARPSFRRADKPGR